MDENMPLLTPEKTAKLQRLHSLDKEIRAGFLQQVLPTEMLLEDIIALHFCYPNKSRKMHFISLLMYTAGITFSTKTRIFAKLLRAS